MTKIRTRRPFLATLAIGLALPLALAACGSSEEGTAPVSSEPIAAVPAPAGQTWKDTAAVTPEMGTLIGNPQAPIKLVEYVSHTCGACANYSAESTGKIDTYLESGRVSLEVRNQVHNPVDLAVSLLARCGDPATFYPLSQQVWADLNTIMQTAQANAAAMNGQGDDRFVQIANGAGLIDFFAARGLSRDQATQCLSDTAKAESIVKASNDQSEELGVTGTPTFFLNGQKLPETNWASVEAALQQAGAR